VKTGTLVGLAGFVGLGAIMAASWGYSEPAYHGRRLTIWLKQYSDTPLDEAQRRSEAEKAVRMIGARKALPCLLEMVEASDGPIRSWLIENHDKWRLRFLNLREAVDIQQLGIAGFEILGTNCASAVPKLALLMQDTNHAFTALRCLIGIGEPAEVPVCQALTNKSPEIRRFAAQQLAWVTDDIEVYLARMSGPLNDSDATVRFAAVQALGLQTQYPEEVIPLLVKAMADPAQSVAGYAAKFLGDFGTNGVGAFASLSNLVQNGSPYMAGQALNSLIAIDPDQALPIALRLLDSSDFNQRAHAAFALGLFIDGPLRPFRDARRNSVPFITKLLDDPDLFVRMTSSNALKEIDAAAVLKAGVN
jgi:HEAT repeat protein